MEQVRSQETCLFLHQFFFYDLLVLKQEAERSPLPPPCKFSKVPSESDRNATIVSRSSAILSWTVCQQMDEEKARVEDLLRRGEEVLQQTSEEGQREELRLLLLRLQSQYAAHWVRCSLPSQA